MLVCHVIFLSLYGGRSDCWLLVVRMVEHAETHGVLLFVVFLLLLYGLEGQAPVLLLLFRLLWVLWLLSLLLGLASCLLRSGFWTPAVAVVVVVPPVVSRGSPVWGRLPYLGVRRDPSLVLGESLEVCGSGYQ